jgi:hypothetical protein
MRTIIEEIALAIEGVWVKTKVQLELLRTLLDSKLLISDLIDNASSYQSERIEQSMFRSGYKASVFAYIFSRFETDRGVLC